MFLLKTITPEQATGRVAEIYSSFPAQVGVPVPLRMISASEPLLEFQARMIGYYMNHPTLSPQVLTAIRYLSAEICAYDYCIDFNGGLLKAAGMTADELEAFRNDPDAGPFEDRENALIAFVTSAIKDPESVTAQQIDRLRELGWADQDIFEAMSHAAGMLGPAVLGRALRTR